MGASPATTISEASILSRLLDVRAADLSPGAAEFLLSIRFPADDMERMICWQLCSLERDSCSKPIPTIDWRSSPARPRASLTPGTTGGTTAPGQRQGLSAGLLRVEPPSKGCG